MRWPPPPPPNPPGPQALCQLNGPIRRGLDPRQACCGDFSELPRPAMRAGSVAEVRWLRGSCGGGPRRVDYLMRDSKMCGMRTSCDYDRVMQHVKVRPHGPLDPSGEDS